MRMTGKLFVPALVVLAVQLVRCGAADEGSAGACEGGLPASVVYDGAASDEAIERVWDRLCDARTLADAASLTSPAEGAVVSSTSAPTLRWAQQLSLAPARALPRQRTSGFSLPSISFGVQPAWAHLPPVTGWVYLLELRPASGDSLWVFTDQLQWTPDPVSWRRIASGGEITVRITSAYLNQNVVEEGPWQGEARAFRIGAD